MPIPLVKATGLILDKRAVPEYPGFFLQLLKQQC